MSTQTAAESTSLLSHSPSPATTGDEGGYKLTEVTTQYGNSFTAYAVTINYIIGAGVLGLPFAFYQAGVPLTAATLLFFFFFTVLGCWWVIEIMSRANGISKTMENFRLSRNERSKQELPPMLSTTPTNTSVADPAGPLPPVHCVENVVWPFSEFSSYFGGPVGKWFCEFVLICYTYGCLWAFTATFSSSLASLVFTYVVDGECNIYDNPSAACHGAYYASIGLFSLIVIPLALMDIAEQQALQVILTVYRFVAFTLMVVTALASIISNGSPVASSRLFGLRWSGFGIMFPSAAFALNVHYNLPDALTPNKNKSHLKQIAFFAELTSLLFYVLVGTVCAAAFDPPLPLVTLNWSNYTGRAGGWGPGKAHWWAVVLRLAIILLPVVDLANVFPLCSITLAGNFTSALPMSTKRKFSPKVLRVSTRLAAAIPPLVMAAILGKLNIIFTVTGLFAFALEYVIPPVMQYLSSRQCIRTWGKGSERTPYTGWYSKTGWLILTLVCGCAAWVVAIAVSACPSCFS